MKNYLPVCAITIAFTSRSAVGVKGTSFIYSKALIFFVENINLDAGTNVTYVKSTTYSGDNPTPNTGTGEAFCLSGKVLPNLPTTTGSSAPVSRTTIASGNAGFVNSKIKHPTLQAGFAKQIVSLIQLISLGIKHRLTRLRKLYHSASTNLRRPALRMFKRGPQLSNPTT
jgi:hypothetical protein